MIDPRRVGGVAAVALLAAGVLAFTVGGSDKSILVAGYGADEIERLQPSDVALLTPGVTIPLPDVTEQCPVDALDAAAASGDGPVRIVFWHTMTNVLEESLIELTNSYNASQDRVVVQLENQNGYVENIDKYFQSSQRDRPTMVQMPEYMVQQMADSGTALPIGACMQAANFDAEPFVPSVLVAYQTEGAQWAMPFNVSGPVLYYNKAMFEEAGLDPDDPPVTLDEVREYSQQIVDAGVATYGIALDHGADSGGGWFLEQWLARMGLPYSDYGNGRQARSTEVLFNTPETVELLEGVQSLITDGLAVNVGANDSSADVILKLADPNQPAAMGITTSAGLGTVLSIAEAGVIPGIGADQVGVGPMPGPSDVPSALVGGASLYIVDQKTPAETAAAWDYISYLVSAEAQSHWAARTGYVPLRTDATTIEPLASTYTDDQRFKVAFDQLTANEDLAEFSSLGPILGPHRDIRRWTAEMIARIYQGEDVATVLAETEQAADLALTQYAIANPIEPSAFPGVTGSGEAPAASVPDDATPSTVPDATVPGTAVPGDAATGETPGWFAPSASAEAPGWFSGVVVRRPIVADPAPGWFSPD